MATVEQELTPRAVAPGTSEKIRLVAGVGDAESFEDCFGAWLEWMAYRDLSPNTIKLYSRTIEIAHRDLGDLRTSVPEALDAWLQKKGGKAGTVGNRICALTSFYRFLVKTKRLGLNPASELERPKQHKRLPKPVEDLETALCALDRQDEGVEGRRKGESRDMATFLAYTGLRIHEAVKCDWPVPCPEEAFIVGKGNKEEFMQIHHKAREAWDRLGRWPIGARATQRRFEKAGFHPHQLRHWRATSLVRAGVEIAVVSKIMRHSSVQTTMGYSAFQKKQMRDALDSVV